MVKAIIFVLAICLFLTASALAWWTNDPQLNLPICTADGEQHNPQMIQDGQDGAIIVWQDGRGANDRIYAQRVNHWGDMLWAIDGVEACTSGIDHQDPQVISD